MANIPALELANGEEIPQLGLGTWTVKPEVAARVVSDALELGYRHIDTAQMYGNEAQVGEAVAAAGIAREELFITTKLNNNNHNPADVRASFAQSLRDLRTDYVDLFLIHWPLPMHYDGNYPETFRTMLEFVQDGRAKSVGVSNFEIEHLERLRTELGILPVVNQVEAHPYFPNTQLHEYCRENGIRVEAWSPLAQGKVVTDPVLTQIGAEVGKSAAQVALRWAIQREDIIFPRTLHRERMAENLQLFDFALSDEQMDRIAALDAGEAGRQGPNPTVFDRI